MAATSRTEKLELRLSAEAKRQLNAAAAVSQRTVSDFVLTSALARANDVLADRRHFGLGADQWVAFMEALDAPVRELPRTEQLLREPGVFDAGEVR